MTTLNIKPDPDNGYHRALAFILMSIIIIAMLSGCKAKEITTDKQYVYKTDSTSIAYRDSIINTLEHKYASQKEYTTVIENMLANTVKGTAGEKKNKLIPKKEQSLTLSAGQDSILLEGVWEYIDYTWYKASTSNIFKERLDSVTERSKVVTEQYKELLKENKDLNVKLSEKTSDVVKYKTSWKLLVYTFVGGFITCFIIFNWGMVFNAFKWIKKLL